MISKNSALKGLKRLNITYQIIGILCVINILWFSIISWIGFISITILILIVFLLLKYKKKAISIEIKAEEKKLLVTLYTKKTKEFTLNSVTYKSIPGQITLYKKNKMIVKVEKYTWSNFDLISEFVYKNCKKNNYKSELKKLASDIIKEEALDYDPNMNSE